MQTPCVHWFIKCGKWWEPPRKSGEEKGRKKAGPQIYILTESTEIVSPSNLPVKVTLWPACAVTLS